MNKKLTKPYAKNIRLDAPLGLLGVPPDFNFNSKEPIILIARMSEKQLSEITNILQGGTNIQAQ